LLIEEEVHLDLMLYLLIILTTFLTHIQAFYRKTSGYYHLEFYDYFNHETTTLEINNWRYRETLFTNTLHFVPKLKANVNYTFKVNNMDVFPKLKYIYPYQNIKSNCKLSDNGNLIYPNSSIEICYSNYFYETEHRLNIIGNFVQYPNHECNKLIVYVDEIPYKILGTNFHKKMNLLKGYHTFYVKIINCGNLPIANAPSIGNGYNSTRYLFMWIEQKYKTTELPISINIKHRENESNVVVDNINIADIFTVFKKAY